MENCLRTEYCFLRGMSYFECSLERFYKQKRFCFYFKRRLIVLDIKFEIWVVAVRKHFVTRNLQKYLTSHKQNSLHLAWKYARSFTVKEKITHVCGEPGVGCTLATNIHTNYYGAPNQSIFPLYFCDLWSYMVNSTFYMINYLLFVWSIWL